MATPRNRMWMLAIYAIGVAGTMWWDGGWRPLRAQQPDAAAAAPRIANPHGAIEVACEVCHSADSWTSVRQPLDFDHGATGFALVGAHQRAACTSCHASLVFSHVGTSCADCHRDVHEGQRGRRCQDCHGTDQWVGRGDAIRSHATTSFPLEGRHALVECSRCHAGVGEASNTMLSSECVACHAENYAATTQPGHAAAGYSTRCEECHDVAAVAWTAGTFDHAARGFPLTGAHATVSCLECHVPGNFAAARADCNACHQDAYMAATNPNHQQNNFPTECSACHGTTSWSAATFNHDGTSFPLRGAHVTVSCNQCHANGNYKNLQTECVACHQAAFDATTSPNHRDANLPTDCTSCHSTTAWRPATFNHDATLFPLRGAHAAVSCNQCHVSGNYTSLQTECVACHQAAFDATTSPNHRDASFSTDCVSCHSTTAWRPATFDHDTQYFRIYSGRHRGTWSSCSTCHVSPSYSVFTCLECHQHEQTTTDSHHRQVRNYQYESSACYGCHRNS